MPALPDSASKSGTDAMLKLASGWLQQELVLAPEALTQVKHIQGKQRSDYAGIFAEQYNNLVGMGTTGDMLKLFKGIDPRGNGPFLESVLRVQHCASVLDTCGGCQYDAIYLRGAADRGDIPLDRLVSNELDDKLLAQGEKNLREVEQNTTFTRPEITRYPWQELALRFGNKSFDACLCMGNSLSHIGDPDQRRLCIDNFADVARKVVVVDTRNFAQMLANKDPIRTKAQQMIRGEAADAGNRSLFPGSVANQPVYIDKEKVIVAYVKDGKPYALVEFSPLGVPVLLEELNKRFRKVEILGNRSVPITDIRTLGDLNAPASIQFVCTEPKNTVQ